MAPKSKTGGEYKPSSPKSLYTLYQTIVRDYEKAGVCPRIPKKITIKRRLCVIVGNHDHSEPMYVSPVGIPLESVDITNGKPEIGSDNEIDDHAGEAAIEEVSEETHQRRCAKRRYAIATVKAGVEYKEFNANRNTIHLAAEPLTPDPEDQMVTKRQWEAGLMEWRDRFREWILDNTGLRDLDHPPEQQADTDQSEPSANRAG